MVTELAQTFSQLLHQDPFRVHSTQKYVKIDVTAVLLIEDC